MNKLVGTQKPEIAPSLVTGDERIEALTKRTGHRAVCDRIGSL